ncbi:MAG: hypothetical protein QG602_508 [Verrucomicrobiota bacterium]|nr:hypothetical protein [Verrucomicrobiota bacterium]
MKVVFRCDSSRLIGTGHVVRCLTLAHELRRRGAEIRFITRAHDGHLAGRLAAELMPVTLLPAPSSEMTATAADAYAVWRGVSVEQDARETIAALGAEKPNWLIVDNYGLDDAWETALRPHCGRMLAIDDLPNRAHECDIFLNQNLGATHGHLPAGCKVLLGPRYALLRPEYSAARALKAPEEAGEVRRVLVFFGGVDEENLTGRTLRVLSKTPFAGLAVDVVIGPNYPHRASLEVLSASRGRTRILSGRPHLADLLLQADVAIGAGGGATWERLCLGVPSILIGVSDNQLTACHSLAHDGSAVYLGPLAEFTEAMLSDELQALLGSVENRRHLASAGCRLVDGLGALRVAERLLPTPAGDCFIRHESNHRFTLQADGLPVAELEFGTHQDGLTVSTLVLEPDGATAATARLLIGALNLFRAALPAERRYIRLMPDGLARGSVESSGRRLAVLSDSTSWLNETVAGLVLGWLGEGHSVEWAHNPAELLGGEFCFFLGCGQLVPAGIRARYRHNLIVHESALPHGKGWSPLTWQVLEGRTEIPVSLIEAVERVDSGVIYAQELIQLRGDELVAELRERQAAATLALCRSFVQNYPHCVAQARSQSGEESFYSRRRAEDSRLEPARTLAEQFNQLRVADNERYPAFFEHQGRRYRLAITAS